MALMGEYEQKGVRFIDFGIEWPSTCWADLWGKTGSHDQPAGHYELMVDHGGRETLT